MLKSTIIPAITLVATLGLAASVAIGSAIAAEIKSADKKIEKSTQTTHAAKKLKNAINAKYLFNSSINGDQVKTNFGGSYTGPKNAITINGIN